MTPEERDIDHEIHGGGAILGAGIAIGICLLVAVVIIGIVVLGRAHL